MQSKVINVKDLCLTHSKNNFA